MASYNDKQRDVKRRYRKDAFQTGYDQAGDSVDATPLPFHSYSTETHTATQPVRPGSMPAPTSATSVPPSNPSRAFVR